MRAYADAISKFGKENQINKAVEELTELSLALQHRGKVGRNSILNEMADVYIMLHQLILIFDDKNLFEGFVNVKIERLEKLINGVKDED